MKYEPKPDHFDVVSLLGRCCGQIGMVLLAKHKQKSLVAVKKFDLEKADHKDVIQIQASCQLRVEWHYFSQVHI